MIITVASFKGGVSKSTSAVHLAAFLNGRTKVSGRRLTSLVLRRRSTDS